MNRKNFLSKYEEKILKIDSNKEIVIPENYIMVYMTRKGEVILCKDNKKDEEIGGSSHYYTAENYYHIEKQDGEPDSIGLFKLVAEGNIALIELDDEQLMIINRENTINKKQQKRLDELKEKGYEICNYPESEERLKEEINCDSLPEILDEEEKEDKIEIEEKNTTLGQLNIGPALV